MSKATRSGYYKYLCATAKGKMYWKKFRKTDWYSIKR